MLEHKHPVRCTPLLRWLCTRRNNNKLYLKQKTSPSPPASPYVKVLSAPSATKADHSPSWQRNCVYRIQLHYYQTVKVLFAQWFLILCYHMDCSLPGSSVYGDSPGKNTGVGCHVLLQGIFPTQGSNPGLPHCRQILYHLSHQGNLLPRKGIISAGNQSSEHGCKGS